MNNQNPVIENLLALISETLILVFINQLGASGKLNDETNAISENLKNRLIDIMDKIN